MDLERGWGWDSGGDSVWGWDWGWDGVLLDVVALWCALCVVVAVVGFLRSAFGLSTAQRRVHVTGRIERVDEVRHGRTHRDGIGVVVTFTDPATGERHTVTNDGECGDPVRTAWTGREIGIHYPRGFPHAFRFNDPLVSPGKGLVLPATAVFLLYAGLVTWAAIAWEWPWALLGAGLPWTLFAVPYLPQSLSERKAALRRLTTVPPVPGRVVAVLRHTSTDADGDTSTQHTPVVAFTTHDGTDVIAYRDEDLKDREKSLGRELAIHYAPDDPAVFTVDLAAEQRGRRSDAVFGFVITVIGIGLLAAGLILLLGP
ncbi:DUF3592 domain-containing protein [Streptomyces sp. NPDC090025]|uniref:DUF3592 domain-containing protein n=1 Tax=Streptomyces sp. NPDC090025 TaxID=3365922 RepID=UPI003835D912